MNGTESLGDLRPPASFRCGRMYRERDAEEGRVIGVLRTRFRSPSVMPWPFGEAEKLFGGVVVRLDPPTSTCSSAPRPIAYPDAYPMARCLSSSESKDHMRH